MGWEEYAEKEREFKHAEKDRLLYVAVSRVKQLLIISQYPSKPAIDPWSSLATTLQHQVELDITPVDPVQPEELTEIPDIVASLSKWQNKLEQQCSQLSYQVTSVTGDNKTSNVIKLERSLEGKGMAYGSLVHRCLQMLGEGMELKDLTDFCSLAAEEEGVEEQWIKQAEEMTLQVTGSDLWKRCMNSLQRYHEFSFMATNNVTNSDVPMTTILRGIIDLVFEEEDGWVIVDFKTDRYNMEQELQFVEIIHDYGLYRHNRR